MSKSRELEFNRRDQIRLSSKASSIVRILANFVTAFFVVKILWEFVAGFSLTPQGAWAFVQITSLVYFWSWFRAAIKGIETQSLLLNSTTSSDQIPFAGYFALVVGFPIGVAAMGLVLFPNLAGEWISSYWSRSVTELLVVILAVFWIWDMLWQWSVRKTMLGRIERTKASFIQSTAKRYIEIEQLFFLEAFLFGRWRILRQIFGVVVIVSLLMVVFVTDTRINVPILQATVSKISVVAISVFLFVVISEGWIWFMRVRMSTGISSVETIGRKYNLVKISK